MDPTKATKPEKGTCSKACSMSSPNVWTLDWLGASKLFRSGVMPTTSWNYIHCCAQGMPCQDTNWKTPRIAQGGVGPLWPLRLEAAALLCFLPRFRICCEICFSSFLGKCHWKIICFLCSCCWLQDISLVTSPFAFNTSWNRCVCRVYGCALRHVATRFVYSPGF